MLPVGEIVDYPVVKIVRQCEISQFSEQTTMPYTAKGLSKVKGNDVDIRYDTVDLRALKS